MINKVQINRDWIWSRSKSMIKRPRFWLLSALVALLASLGGYRLLTDGSQQVFENAAQTKNGFNLSENVPHEIPLEKIISGGPGRDGIPAIDKPKFNQVAAARDVPDDTLGIFVELAGQKRYYPHTILNWHEIVNDQINGQPIAVTFCPLCASAAVYDRQINGQTVRFGVSGLLHESNLLMYDDATETLWSQSIGKAVVGKQTGTKLTRLPTQVLLFSDVKINHPEVQVLSTDTGYNRDYSINPYSGYEETEDTLFEVSVNDTRLPAKTIMYVIPVDDRSVAFVQTDLEDSQAQEASFFGKKLVAQKEKGEINITVDGKSQPGYYEMWFSWATQHQKDGELWKI